ncbi:MAG: helix-turn-helix transcriptional regulator, partial [Lentilitoribacter sp.]
KHRGLSLRQLESLTEKMGHKVHRNTLSKIERDRYSTFSPQQIRVICLALGISADWWFLGDDRPANAVGAYNHGLSKNEKQSVLQTISLLKKLLGE